MLILFELTYLFTWPPTAVFNTVIQAKWIICAFVFGINTKLFGYTIPYLKQNYNADKKLYNVNYIKSEIEMKTILFYDLNL